MSHILAKAPLGLAAVLFAISGCAAGSPASGASSTTPPSVAVATAPSGQPPSRPTGATGGSTVGGVSAAGGGSVEDGLGHTVNVCGLLPVATVASVTHEPLATATENDTTSYKIYACSYTSADGTSGVDVSVLALDAAAGYEGSLQAAGADAKQITGLGDKAFSSILGVEALFGNVSITVSNLQSDAAAESLIRTLQPNL